MKKSLSLVLAVLMVAALLVPILSVTIAATGASTASTYLVYQQDFESVSADAEGSALLAQLGWYVPAAKVDTHEAAYSIVGVGTAGHALRVNTLGASGESFINVLTGNVMSALRDSNFVLKYRITYNEETTNNDGYAAFIYNYNEQHGSVANSEGNEVYGIAAVRMCGTGLNAVYYPVAGAACALHSIEKDPGSPNTMTSRYDAPSGQPSLYGRLFDSSEAATDIRKGTNVMANRALDVEIAYDAKQGVTVSINGILVSEMNYDLQYNDQFRNEDLWEDFMLRNGGSSIALLVQPGIVADIDNITVETADLDAATDNTELPALLITETSFYSSDSWNEFVEIYNPTDKPVDVSDYSLIIGNRYMNGSATDETFVDRTQTYLGYMRLGDYFGTVMEYAHPQFVTLESYEATNCKKTPDMWYFTAEEMATIAAMGFDIERADDKTYKRSNTGTAKDYIGNTCTYHDYVEDDAGTYYLYDIGGAEIPFNSNYVPEEGGPFRLANFVDNWNTRYTHGATDYASNTLLNPGECMLLRLADVEKTAHWINGVTNNGDLSNSFASKGFRNLYKNYGLAEDTKILVIDNEFGRTFDNDATSFTISIGATYDKAGNEIDYTQRHVCDLSDIQSTVTHMPSLLSGNPTQENRHQYVVKNDSDPDSNLAGNGGRAMPGYSGVYVYGVDASTDYRRGVLYTNLNGVQKDYSHVGKLADYQKILIGDFYGRTDKTPPLMITEILPYTNNLKGEEMNAFPAMELTNTSGAALDLYNYSLVRTESGVNGAKTDSGFKYSTALKAGNPVAKGEGNGAYYYFAQNSISNPEICMLQPGESVVVWFVNQDTYASYYTDDEFGVEYFRQYWVNNGCPDLGMKNTDGEYMVKVVAVDGCTSDIYNAPNAERVFSPVAGTSENDKKGKFYHDTSAVYGIANVAGEVMTGAVPSEDVSSVAYYGLISIYYELHKTAVVGIDGAVSYTNVLQSARIPVNTGMRYVADLGYSNRISAMKISLKVLETTYTPKEAGGVLISDTPDVTFRYAVRTKSANQKAGLGTLEGAEAYCVRDSLFIATTEQGSNTTVYRYFAENRNTIATLTGAAVSTVENAPTKLRFDSVVRLDTYTSLVATYGNNAKFGTLIVKSSALSNDTAMTKESLVALGAQDVESELLYYTDDFAVLGAAIVVGTTDYETEYTAISYMEVTTQDGVTHVYYSGDTTARSVELIARAAMRDVADVSDGTYKYQLENGKYSRFNEDEREVLNGYLA